MAAHAGKAARTAVDHFRQLPGCQVTALCIADGGPWPDLMEVVCCLGHFSLSSILGTQRVGHCMALGAEDGRRRHPRALRRRKLRCRRCCWPGDRFHWLCPGVSVHSPAPGRLCDADIRGELVRERERLKQCRISHLPFARPALWHIEARHLRQSPKSPPARRFMSGLPAAARRFARCFC